LRSTNGALALAHIPGPVRETKAARKLAPKMSQIANRFDTSMNRTS
jgi:hypothetical protein